MLEVLSIYYVLKESSLGPNPTTPRTKESPGANKVNSSAACCNTFCSAVRSSSIQISKSRKAILNQESQHAYKKTKSGRACHVVRARGRVAMLLFRLCRGGDVWPAARHLTFPCSISPVCGMAGAPLTCLQAWWEVLRGLGMKIPSQRRLGFYFDVRTFVLFYYLIESLSFCCFFPNNSSQERINF